MHKPTTHIGMTTNTDTDAQNIHSDSQGEST